MLWESSYFAEDPVENWLGTCVCVCVWNQRRYSTDDFWLRTQDRWSIWTSTASISENNLELVGYDPFLGRLVKPCNTLQSTHWIHTHNDWYWYRHFCCMLQLLCATGGKATSCWPTDRRPLCSTGWHLLSRGASLKSWLQFFARQDSCDLEQRVMQVMHEHMEEQQATNRPKLMATVPFSRRQLSAQELRSLRRQVREDWDVELGCRWSNWGSARVADLTSVMRCHGGRLAARWTMMNYCTCLQTVRMNCWWHSDATEFCCYLWMCQ